MARERRPLIEPGIIPSEGDVFSRILANDRERRRGEVGRADGVSPDPGVDAGDAIGMVGEGTARASGDAEQGYNVTENERTLQRTNVTRLQDTTHQEDAPQNGGEEIPTRRRRRGGPPGINASGETPETVAPVEPALRTERLGKALDLAAAGEIAVVTVRAPAKLNEYMDRYVDRVNRVNPKRRYRKQDAVAEAFAAFFADHLLPPAPAEEEL